MIEAVCVCVRLVTTCRSDQPEHRANKRARTRMRARVLSAGEKAGRLAAEGEAAAHDVTTACADPELRRVHWQAELVRLGSAKAANPDGPSEAVPEPEAEDGNLPISLRDFLDGAVVHQAHLVFEEAVDPFVKPRMRAAYPNDPADAEDTEYLDAEATWARQPDQDAADAERLQLELSAKEAEVKRTQAVFAAAVGKEKNQAKGPANAARRERDHLVADIWFLRGNFQAELARVELSVADLTSGREGQQQIALADAQTRLGYHPQSAEAKQLARAQKKVIAREKKKSGPQPRWIRECRGAVASAMRPFVNDDGVRWDLYTLTAIMRAHLEPVLYCISR
eukprot:SAG11_NODE_7590_length_1124_cov_1.507317_1_plen_338_part_00